jgi:hypothetical protein
LTINKLERLLNDAGELKILDRGQFFRSSPKSGHTIELLLTLWSLSLLVGTNRCIVAGRDIHTFSTHTRYPKISKKPNAQEQYEGEPLIPTAYSQTQISHKHINLQTEVKPFQNQLRNYIHVLEHYVTKIA